MDDNVILGIHSQVDANTQGSFNQLVDGHAWISVTRNGRTERYGLWPDSHPRGLDNGPASDIRRGIESEPGFNPTASRYFQLTPEQVARLETALRENVTWGYTNTCASWASETTSRVTGQAIDATEYLVTETPRELIDSLRALERGRPTSPANPLRPDEISRGSSSFGALTPDPAMRETRMAGLDPAQPDQAIYQQARSGVQQLDARLQRTPDDASERMAASLAVLASRSGFERIDHVALSVESDRVKAGENVFVVQGRLDDPAQLRAHMRTDVAVATPVEDSLQQMAQVQQGQVEQRIAQRTQQAGLDAERPNPQQEPQRQTMS